MKKRKARGAPKGPLTVKDAIPTTYNGVEMKSRLEAQCAYLLDCLGWDWQYEPTSYMLPNGVSFTPDFLVTDQGLFIECRGYDSAKGNRQLAGFIGMMKGGVPAIEGEEPVRSFIVLFGDKEAINLDRERYTGMLHLVHCRYCGWYPGQLSGELNESMSIPEVYCTACMAPMSMPSWDKWDGKARVDACAVVTVSKGKILVNGQGSESWGWISDLGPGKYAQE